MIGLLVLSLLASLVVWAMCERAAVDDEHGERQ